jgi:hypothetical protein
VRALLLVLIAGCGSPELTLEIRLPEDRRLLSSVESLHLSASRDGTVLAQTSFAGTADYVSVGGVSHGARTVITLEGLDSSGDLIARGSTCPVDFQGATSAPLYFAPTNFFAPTANAPLATRERPAALPLDSGIVLIAGGSNDTSVERFTPGAGTFASAGVQLEQPRSRPEVVALSSIGLLFVGGADGAGNALASAELYVEAESAFLPLMSPLFDARVGHRVSLLPDGRAFVSGGSATLGGEPLATTLYIYVLSDATYQVTEGPQLMEARRDHAATVAIGVPMMFGGYGPNGAVLDSVEALGSPDLMHLKQARAEATATPLSDGSILLVGGIGADKSPLATAELFNPVTRTTTVYPMAAARRGHTATLLSDGRVLVTGGLDASDSPMASVELFALDAGFLSERSLGTARGNHVAVSLCDGTVLLIGGGSGAELYSGG